MSEKKCKQTGTFANEAPARASRRTIRGPEPERLKIEGNWAKAVSVALRKPKPPGGWPK